MGCAVSCYDRTAMSLFGRYNNNGNDDRVKLERKLYIAKESPEPEFDLSECQLRHVPSGTFCICKVYRKEYLYLHCNNLQTLEEGGHLSDLYLIRVLNLSSNKFTQIPNDIRFWVNMTELYLQDNYIKAIPESIQYLQSLQIFDVSSNKLRSLTPSLGKLKSLRKLNLTENKDLNKLCPELCFATNIIQIDLDCEQFVFPPFEVVSQTTKEIMEFLCNSMNVEYNLPLSSEEALSAQTPSSPHDPFARYNTMTWEEQEAAIVEQENKLHRAAKEQRDKFLSRVLQEQVELDGEIAKVQEARDIERQRLISAIQHDEKEIECLVTNFIQSDNLMPEVIQQQLAYEQAEHDRLLEMTRQNYDNIKKTDILRAMEELLKEDYSIKHSQRHYEDSMNNMKQSILMQDLEVSEKLEELLSAKDQSRSVLIEQLLDDQDVQKAIVATLVERMDSRSWSLNQEISLISSHLARLSVIEQEKKKLQIVYNYNELLHQRVHLLNLLDDLFVQQNKRKNQLIDTMKEMEQQEYKTADFWLKNYQKIVESAPRTLLNVSKSLDPLLANYLLQEGVIHCLPFLVKFLFSDESVMSITREKLKHNGVTLSSDRENILKAIALYVSAKSESYNFKPSTSLEPSAPMELNCTGVVNSDAEESTLESECVICMDAKCEVVFVPCGHMCCCQPCAIQDNVDSCPMCRSHIERTMKVIIA